MSGTNRVAAIWQILKEAPAVYAITRQNVYPNILPQNTPYPAVVYGQVAEDFLETKDAPIHNGYRVAVEVYAETYAKAQQLVTAIRDAIGNYTGTIAGLGFTRIRFVNQTDGIFEEDLEVFKISLDFSIKIN